MIKCYSEAIDPVVYKREKDIFLGLVVPVNSSFTKVRFRDYVIHPAVRISFPDNDVERGVQNLIFSMIFFTILSFFCHRPTSQSNKKYLYKPSVAIAICLSILEKFLKSD